MDKLKSAVELKKEDDSKNTDENCETENQDKESNENVTVKTNSVSSSDSEPEDEIEMDSSMRAPLQMNFDGNLKENWKTWQQAFEIYMVASGLDAKPAERQVAVLLHTIGPEGIKKYNTFGLTEAQKKDTKEVLKAFENFCTPKSNESVERHFFNMRSQQPGEKFLTFVTDLKNLSASCGYGELRESLIRDRIICGIRDHDLKNRLLQEENLTLEKCVNMCKSAELAETQVKTMEKSAENKINVLSSAINKDNRKTVHKDHGTHTTQKKFQTQKYKHAVNSQSSSQKTCGKCGKSHKPRECPAFGKTCHKCGKPNHFSSKCNKQNIQYIQDSSSVGKVGAVETLFIGMVKSDNSVKEWYENIKVNNNHNLKVKLDTGAHCNVMSCFDLKNLNISKSMIQKTKMTLCSYGGNNIEVQGQITLSCKIKNQKVNIEFIVVNGQHGQIPTILGLPTIVSLGLIKKIDLINEIKSTKTLVEEYKDIFEGSGYIKDYEYDIKIEKNAPGRIEPCRRVPIPLMGELKNNLDMMETNDIIEKVDKPTKWVNPLVIVKKKDGSLRICLDPTILNQYILRQHFQLPNFEELSSDMPNARYFTILDADSAFWQIKVSEQSSDLLTFSTPFGRYKFKRMAYGIKSASEVFQDCCSRIFGDIKGVKLFIDDILIWGSTLEELNIRVEQVFKRAREYNVRFNKNKCKFEQQEVKYMGHLFTREGIKVDEEKIRAIIQMKQPKNKEELDTFLGMITYVGRFVPNLSEKNATLRNLKKKNVIWHWDANAQKSFLDLKTALTQAPVLKYYDVNKPVTLSVDASQNGLGAVLLQDELPVAYASRALSDVERRYAQIEKEALAICFGCEKFHQYIFSKTIKVESDHKPLESIFRKPFNQCPARIQRMKLNVQKYDLIVSYKPGKELLLADALSRVFLDETNSSITEEIEAQVCLIEEKLPVTIQKRQEFIDESQKDEEIQLLIKFTNSGWPMNKTKLPNIVKPYFSFADELNVINGLVFKGERLVVPKVLRKMVLDKIHYAHLGIEKCKLLAREAVYWPNMSKEIEDIVENCEACNKFKKLNNKEPMLLREVPEAPWETIALDLFYYKGNEYLLAVDYYSKYVEVGLLESSTSKTVINLLKSLFARNGIPKLIYSDNGPQFSNEEMKQFSKTWQFEHVTSSPTYPQSNGLVERHIQTVKNMFKKLEVDEKDPFLALLELRNTPINGTLKSPNEILRGRKVRGIMPVQNDKPVINDYKKIKSLLENRQNIQKCYYDKTAHYKKPVKIDDKVFVKTRANYPLEQGTIIERCDRPRSYKIEFKNGRTLERNRRHLFLGGQDDTNQIINQTSETNNNDGDLNNWKRLAENQSNDNPEQGGSTTSNDQRTNSDMVTRSGRVVKLPEKYNDYVM